MTIKTVERSLLLPYSPGQMYALVNDVERYPQFLPGCAAARVVEADAAHMVAAVDIRKGPLHLSFTTRNRLEPDRRIDMELIDGSFRSLRGAWRFDDIAGEGVRATLTLEYDFAARAAKLLLEPVFDRVCQSIMGAFARRANEIYRT
ncbi:MAG TPA: type II toxin-antitoxin system RatA family toxin [Steroidobacteraceae bacterium]|nr:type II toxin-antitoxin system RatA family toxin [Steroidobacteraceae bacterium]